MKASIDLKPRLMCGEVRAFGPGKADLLAQIDKTGSISAAARAMSMSYSRAWLLVDAMNGAFRQPLVEAAPGGAKGGGAIVTALGRDVLALYLAMRADLDQRSLDYLAKFAPLLR